MPRITYANVTATVALAFALGTGGAYAATELAADSVGAREIKRGAVRSSEIRNGSVGLADLSAAAREGRVPPKARLAQAVEEVITDPALGLTIKVQGEKGEKGDPGAAGVAGEQGVPGIADVVVRTQTDAIGGNATLTVAARCEAGERAIGGGGRLSGPTAGTVNDGGDLVGSFPLEDAAGWAASVSNQASTASTVTAFAVCAKVGA